MSTTLERAAPGARWIDRLQPLALLALRLYVGQVFFRSGWLKISDWSSTLFLFADEYHVPLLSPGLAAVMGTAGELVFSTLLVLGLFGRIGAAGLFFVNLMAVISYPQLRELECPAAINSHWYWGSMIALLFVFGPGRLAIDAWLMQRQRAA